MSAPRPRVGSLGRGRSTPSPGRLPGNSRLLGGDLQITSGAFTTVTHRAFGKWIDKRLGQWIHVAVTLQRGGKAIFYVDGKATGDTFTYKSSSRQALAAETRDLYLGAPDPGHHRNRSWFDGWMDEVRIYDRALLPDEVRALFEFGR